MLPSMEMDVLDEMLGSAAGSGAQQQGLPSTVGNSYILKLAKSGVTDVRTPPVLPGHPHCSRRNPLLRSWHITPGA